MNRSKRLLRAGILMSGIGIAAAASVGSARAAGQPPSVASAPTTVAVIRGSNTTAVPPSSGNDTAPVVLRGTPLPLLQSPPAGYACPSGYLYDPSYGCVASGYAYEPADYGYWPYYGFDGFYFGNLRHRSQTGFAHRAVHFDHRPIHGFGHGLAHVGRFAHR